MIVSTNFVSAVPLSVIWGLARSLVFLVDFTVTGDGGGVWVCHPGFRDVCKDGYQPCSHGFLWRFCGEGAGFSLTWRKAMKTVLLHR